MGVYMFESSGSALRLLSMSPDWSIWTESYNRDQHSISVLPNEDIVVCNEMECVLLHSCASHCHDPHHKLTIMDPQKVLELKSEIEGALGPTIEANISFPSYTAVLADGRIPVADYTSVHVVDIRKDVHANARHEELKTPRGEFSNQKKKKKTYVLI